MPSAPGIVVVDATFLKHLKAPASVAAIETALRTAHLRLVLSVANVLEALKHPNPEIRAELIAAIRRWSIDRPLNPWPLELLRLAGAAFPASEFTFGPTDIDLLIRRAGALDAEHAEAARFLDGLHAKFVDAYASNRPAFQNTLKATRQKYAWPDIPSFLASPDWSARSNLEHLTGVIWQLAGLHDQPPAHEIVSQSEIWRLALDVFGAATYLHSVRPNRVANAPGPVDLLQLVYLSENNRARIFVTDDGSLYDAATQILRGRYVNVRVVRANDFLGAAV